MTQAFDAMIVAARTGGTIPAGTIAAQVSHENELTLVLDLVALPGISHTNPALAVRGRPESHMDRELIKAGVANPGDGRRSLVEDK